VTNGVVIVMY